MATKAITDDSFTNDVTNSEGFVVVDFWAEWCGPCKSIAPSLEEISDELENVTICKMDIDENPNTPTAQGVRGVPTMVLYKDGERVDVKVGAAPKSQIKEWIENNM